MEGVAPQTRASSGSAARQVDHSLALRSTNAEQRLSKKTPDHTKMKTNVSLVKPTTLEEHNQRLTKSTTKDSLVTNGSLVKTNDSQR